MDKINKYYLHVKDVMRDYVFALDYESLEELASAYGKYSKDSDYEIVSMHSMCVETTVIMPRDLIEHSADCIV